MASITKEGNKYYIRIYIEGKERRLRGFRNKREATRVGEILEQVKTSAVTGVIPPDVALWLSEIRKTNSVLLQKIVDLGLLPKATLPHTLGELIAENKRCATVSDTTLETWDNVSRNLLDYFGEDKILESITLEDITKFSFWLRTEPLNLRVKVPIPYAPATVAKRLSIAKGFFSFAEKIGWLKKNPFRFLSLNQLDNPESLEYVPVAKICALLPTVSPRWAVIIGMCRFAGARGSSELYRMEWQDVHWSTPKQPGWVAIQTKKNAVHGRAFRVVPMCSFLEDAFKRLRDTTEKPTGKIFPDMEARKSFCIPLQKMLRRADIKVWKRPWYNMRKSFCSDMLERIIDINYYETLTDHSYKVAVKYYSIMHRGRVHRGEEMVRRVFNDWEHSVAEASEDRKD